MSEPLTDPPQERTLSRVDALRWLAGVVVVYLLFSLLLPVPRFDFDTIGPMERSLLIFVPTVVFMLLQIGLVRALVIAELNQKQAWIAAAIAFALWYLVLRFVHPLLGLSMMENELLHLLQSTLMGIFLTVGLALLGTQLALIIRDPNLLLPVALVAMPVDFVGAMTSQGFTHTIMTHAPKLVSSVSVSVPAVTTQTRQGVSLGPIAFIGPGDVLFMALYFAVVRKYHLNEPGTFWWIFGLLSGSMLLVIALANFPVGALVPMGIAVIAANYRWFHLKRDEVFAILYATVLVAVVIGIFFWTSHRMMFAGEGGPHPAK